MASKVTYKLKLTDLVDTTGLTREQEDEIKEQVGQYLYDKILERVSSQSSPVAGERPTWKGIKPKSAYAKEKGSTVANMEFTGDMLDALEYKTRADGIEIGIFKKSEALKADGHCHTGVFGVSKLPRRQFIPREDQNFRREIINELRQLAEDLKEEFEDESEA